MVAPATQIKFLLRSRREHHLQSKHHMVQQLRYINPAGHTSLLSKKEITKPLTIQTIKGGLSYENSPTDPCTESIHIREAT